MNKSVLIISLTAILFFSQNNSQAQIISNITPENIHEVVDEIYTLHGSQIDLDRDEVQNFIENLLPDTENDPNYDNGCNPPQPSMTAINSSRIDYSWSNLPGVHSYQTAYLKLNNSIDPTAESGTVPTLGTSVSLPVESSGLVLVTFQAKCSQNSVGKVNVIIVDKPVFFEHSNEDCTCEFEGPSQSSNFSGVLLQNINQTDIINFDYTHDGPTGYYSSTITYEDGSVSTFLIRVTITDGTIYIAKVCEENMDNDPGGSLLYSVIEGAVLGSVSFNDGITFDPVYGANGEMTVTECLDEDPNHNSSGRSNQDEDHINIKRLIAQPNPGQNYIWFYLPGEESIPNSTIQLSDATGRLIHLPKADINHSDTRIRIDISKLPVGVYTALINNENGIMTTKFIKVN